MNTYANNRWPQRAHAQRFAFAAIIAAGLLLAGGCASTPPPTGEMAVSTAAVARAVSAGATDSAPVEMGIARKKLDSANAAMISKDYDTARTLAQEAQVDAQLAEVKARSTKARKAADAVREDGRALREEIERKAQ